MVRYPNRTLADYLVNGFKYGFDIGYCGSISPGMHGNLKSARYHPREVTAAINKEVERGHTVGPFSVPPFSNFHTSPLGAVPKKDGSYRLILDLSSPEGSSVNDGISHENFSVTYTSFDQATDMVFVSGRGSYMAKIDIKHAFRLCPVHPQDYPLLGIRWQGKYYVDTRLPFGSRSSPFIFNRFADALWWIITTIGCISFVIHYLDDFLVVAKTEHECTQAVKTVKYLFSYLGVPIAMDKLEGPSTKITYLGIEIDSVSGTTRLPLDKVANLRELLEKMSTKKSCKKKKLRSLIGKLSFASRVIKPGRLFLRNLINLSTTVKYDHYYVTLNKESREDILWWLRALTDFNGVSYIMRPFTNSDSMQLHTDASGVGFGGVFNNSWFYHAWPPKFLDPNISIAYKELFAIVVAIETWGHLLRHKQIKIFTDNETICNLWQSLAPKTTDLMHLLRYLYFRAYKFECNVLLVHIPGKYNVLADLLSRLQVEKFLRALPTADTKPTPIPPVVWSI